MEADILSGKFRKPVSLVASSTPCIADWECNHQESRCRPRPPRSAPPTSCPNREATRQSDLLAKLSRLNTDQLYIALCAIAPAEDEEIEEEIKKTNDVDRDSYLLFLLRLRLRCFNAEQLSIALRAVAQAEKEKKMKKKKKNIHLQPRNTERCHGNSSVTNASADCQPTVPSLLPRLRADAPPWSPPANDDGSLSPVESDSYREELETRRLDGDSLPLERVAHLGPKQKHCLLTAAEGGPIDDQADDWELIDSSEIPSLPLTAQGRIDFARLTHEQCDRVDWISAIISAPNGKMIIHKRWVHYMQVLAYADVSAMFMKYESFFLTILTGMDGIPTHPVLYRQKYTNAFLELQQFLPDLKLRICRSWETNPALADVIHDLQQLGASFLFEEDPLECLLSSAPAPTKTLPVNSGFNPNGTPTTESIQRVDTQSCTTEIDPRAQRWISQHAPFRVSHYGDSDTTQSSLSSSDIRVPIPSDEMTIPTGTEASEPPNYQVDARPSAHQTIISEDTPIAPPTDLQTTDANPCASQPVISHQADEIDAPILRTVTYEDDEPVNEPNPCERAGTSDALPDPTQARNTTTDNADDHIAQFIQSMEMTLDDELNKFLQITSDICTTLERVGSKPPNVRPTPNAN